MNKACNEVIQMRRTEGGKLKSDFESRLSKLEGILSQLEKESFTEIERLHNQFENNTNNVLYHIKLGSEYERLGKAKSSNHY